MYNYEQIYTQGGVWFVIFHMICMVEVQKHVARVRETFHRCLYQYPMQKYDENYSLLVSFWHVIIQIHLLDYS